MTRHREPMTFAETDRALKALVVLCVVGAALIAGLGVWALMSR